MGRDFFLATVATGLAICIWMVGWLAPLDRGIGDALLWLTHRSEVDAPVVAVVIDDDSIAQHGGLPWPRSILAEIVAAAHHAGAVAVVVDMLLIEAGDPAGDFGLEEALGEGPSLVAAALGPDGEWLLPHPRFGGSDRAAHVHAEVGPDGVARSLLATKQTRDLSLPAISLAAARALRPEIVVEPGLVIRPDFRPGPDRVDRISALDFLSSLDRVRKVAGRLVFVGITATGFGDRVIVPTVRGPAPSPGVLVHASATASILSDGLVHRLGLGWTMLLTFVVALAQQVLRSRTGVFQPWAMAVIVVAIALLAAVALELWHLLIPVPIVVVGLILSFVLREGGESRAASHDSGRLLRSLLRHHEPGRDMTIPRTSIAKLTALRDLQTAVLRQDAARRTLLAGMHDGVVMWDSEGRVVVVNHAATQLWGGEPGYDDFENFETDNEKDSTTIIRRQGLEIAVSVSAVGEGGIAFLRDITAERELERKRRDTQRLVSHELRTPLASIAGLGETLERYELTPDEQHRVAALIRGESVRLGEMVSTFLDLERLDSKQMTDPLEVLDLGELVAQRLEILAEIARSREQEISRRIEDRVMVRASRVLLARVIDNLVGNALKFSSDGGEIEVLVFDEDPNAILTVTDHGVGIPEDAHLRLFERFYRVPGVEGSGSGLGLAVAKEVVTWHNGCIEVQSVVGQGSTFTVRLLAEE